MNDIILYKDGFCLSTEKTKLDINAIHNFLSTQTDWSLNIPLDRVRKAIDNSLNFGLYFKDNQIGYARIISDFSTIAYLGDVYVLPEFRGKGLSKWLMEVITNYTELQGLRRWILLTGDAHNLYRKYGWTEIADSSKWMELHNKNAYKTR